MRLNPSSRPSHSVRRCARQGYAVVEFAVVAPLLMFLALVAFDFSRVFYYSQTIENSARDGAIFQSGVYNGNYDTSNSTYSLPSWNGSSSTTYSTYQAAAIADASDLSPAETSTNFPASGNPSSTGTAYSSSYPAGTTTDGDGNKCVQVTISYTFSLATNFSYKSSGAGTYNIGNQVSLKRMVQMRAAPQQPTFN